MDPWDRVGQRIKQAQEICTTPKDRGPLSKLTCNWCPLPAVALLPYGNRVPVCKEHEKRQPGGAVGLPARYKYMSDLKI